MKKFKYTICLYQWSANLLSKDTNNNFIIIKQEAKSAY